jgi:dihydrofolate reductase
MRRLVMWNLITLDMLLFSRVTYEGMATYWPTAEGEGEVAPMMNEMPKMVFSRTLERAEWGPSTLVREMEPAAVQRLKEEGEGELLVFGSGSLASGAVLLRYRPGAKG